MTPTTRSRPSVSTSIRTNDPVANHAGSAAASQSTFGIEPKSSLDPIVPRDIAAFIASMVLDLREMAEKSGFDTLGRVLEIAEREAKWRMEDRL